MWGDDDMWDGAMFMGGWMWLWVLLVLGGLVAVGIGLARASGTRGGSGRDARTILEERYARGELTTEQYQERMQVLRDR